MSVQIAAFRVKDIIGLEQLDLNNQSVELTGPTGAGKTSGLDALKFALTGTTGRSVTVRDGAAAGEVELVLNDGTKITRKAFPDKPGSLRIQRGGMVQSKPQGFLNGLFTELQLDPVAFSRAKPQEQNRLLLNTIDFKWDLSWIREQFGEIPEGVNYEAHILEVLAQISAKNGKYYQTRQQINSEALYKRKSAEDIARSLPEGFDFDRWNTYPVSKKYRELAEAQEQNSKISRAQSFRDAYAGKKRGIESQYDIECAAIERGANEDKADLEQRIARMEEQIRAARDKLSGLAKQAETEKAKAAAERDAALAKLDADTGIAAEWADKEPFDTSALQQEIDMAEKMRRHLNEYQRMVETRKEVEALNEKSQSLTDKIELARRLPGEILKTAKLPIPDLTVDENGVPLIRGLPVSSLSDGEKLALCVKIAAAKSGNLRVILLDGMERLDEKRREELYRDCVKSGLMALATRVTDTNGLAVNVIDVAYDEGGEIA